MDEEIIAPCFGCARSGLRAYDVPGSLFGTHMCFDCWCAVKYWEGKRDYVHMVITGELCEKCNGCTGCFDCDIYPCNHCRGSCFCKD